MSAPYYDRPCAALGLISYRYLGPFGWIMTGATGTGDAMNEASRSTCEAIVIERLEIWNGKRYVPVAVPAV